MPNMFSPLNNHEKSAKFPEGDAQESIAIVPIPQDAKGDYPLKNYNRKSIYRNSEGQETMHICRCVGADGKKNDYPVTYRLQPDGSAKWELKSLPAPRPLYGLDRLADRPDAPVLICEGEKATEAAGLIFPDHVAITSPNGAGSPHKADWSPVKGRHIIIWPDHDPEGAEYAKRVAQLCLKVGAESVRIVNVPTHFPQKWDLADPLPDDTDLQNILNSCEAVKDPLDGIVERAKDDPGEAYKPDVLEALADLKKNDLPAWISLRQKLKRAGVGISMLEQEMSKSNPDSENDDPDHITLAREVIEQAGYGNLLGTVAHVWRWREGFGVWRPIVDRELKQVVQRSLEIYGAEISRSLVDAVTDVLKSEIFIPDHAWNPARDVINVLNGELSWIDDQWEIQPHCREHHCTTQIPAIYDPLAACPRFIQFLAEIFAYDSDGKEKAQAILEMIGYTLCSHARHERFIMLVGRGANGKSVILEIVRLLVGIENAAAVQPSQFSNKFQRAHLHLKLANLVTEVAEGAEIADAELKAIVSGESMTAEHKHMPPFDFAPFCTIWLGTNHMPHTRDFSEALFRRALVIPFNRTFKEGIDADSHLKDKLADELPGIMHMALQAYGEVLKRGAFTEPQSCLDAKREWRLQADQAAQFVDEKCVLDSEAAIESAALYSEYESWATNAGINRKLNKKSLTQRMVLLGCTPKPSTKGKRMIYGIRMASWREGGQ